MHSKRIMQKVFGNFFTYLVLIIVVFIINLPTLSMLGTAFKSKSEALSTISLLPSKFHIDSFKYVLGSTDFGSNILNSIYISLVVSLFCIIISAFAAYAISRFKSRLFSLYSVALLLIQMFPGVLMLIPMYLIFKNLNLVDTPYSVMLAYTAIHLPFSIWMLKGFFDTISVELEQSAMVDGATQFRSFISIVLPISLPGIATVGIFAFINSWNEYMLASVLLKSDNVMTVTVGLEKFVQQYTSDWPALMAGSSLAIVPSLLFLLFVQRYLIEGLTAGSLKG